MSLFRTVPDEVSALAHFKPEARGCPPFHKRPTLYYHPSMRGILEKGLNDMGKAIGDYVGTYLIEEKKMPPDSICFVNGHEMTVIGPGSEEGRK